ncbi:MAG: SGNH/GDSL hydrolase family protein [Myxococcota bacterium]
MNARFFDRLLLCSCLSFSMIGVVGCGEAPEADDDEAFDDEAFEDGAEGGDGATLPASFATCMGDASSTGAVMGPLGSMQAVGDSILGWNKEQMASIPDVVGQELGISMVNNAVGGAELGGPEGIPTLYTEGGFSHVLVNGGGNDFARGCSPSVLDGLISADLTSGLMVELIDRITGDGAQAVIVGYYMPQDRETGCELFPELLARYRRLGETRADVMYICTLETITPDTPALYADPVHPSQEGSAAVGRLIARTLRP